ncbi:MAG TPA: RimK family alpha-L-glutamate ligase [archaeon]|nr:RimK family alpha-L-glutamate ligase [archaeon]
MKICIISGVSGNDVKPIIIEEAQKKFDSVLFVPLNKIRIACREGKTSIYYKHTDLSQYDAVWVRVFGEDFVLGELVLDILENSNAYVQSNAEAFQICSHKYYTVKVASAIGIPVPDSSLCVTPEVASKMIKTTGFPAVIKLLSGFGGKGVMLVNSEEEFTPILETLRVFDEFISTQDYIPADAMDYRALVTGNKVMGIKRKGAKGEWRANVATGGTAELIELDDNIKEMAVRAAELIGAEICSVDFLKTKDKYYLVEINFTPGMIKKFFGNKIAKLIIAFLYEKAVERKKQKEEKTKIQKK